MFTSDDFSTITEDENFAEDVDSTDDFNSQDDIAFVDNNGDGVYETMIQGFDTEVEFDYSEPELNLESEEDSFDFDDDENNDLVDVEPEEPGLIAGEYYNNDNDDPIIGDPENYLDDWHKQTYGDTCAVASQEFILDELTGQDFSEEELRQEAMDNGWYIPGGGTPLECMGNLLEAHGIDVERKDSCTFEDLAEQLDQGQNVMVALDSDEIWNPGGFDTDDLMSALVGMPGQDANHAVQVIGIDNSNPNNPMVILNDPGHPEGQGMMVPAEQFMDAWEDSNQYMVYTTGNTVQENESVDLDFGGRNIGLLGDDYDYDDPVEYNTSWGDYHADWAETNAYQGYDSSTDSQYATEYYENAAWEAEHSWDSYY